MNMSEIKVVARSIGFTIYWAFTQEIVDLWAEKLTPDDHQWCLSPVFTINLDEVDANTMRYIG